MPRCNPSMILANQKEGAVCETCGCWTMSLKGALRWRALDHEYGVLSADALRTILAARGVNANVDKLTEFEMRQLAALTHFAVGNEVEMRSIVADWQQERERWGKGPLMVDIP